MQKKKRTFPCAAIFMEERSEACLTFFCTWVPDRIISLTLISFSIRKYRKVEVMR